MRHKVARVITGLVGIMLLVPFALFPTFAQERQRRQEKVEERLKMMDREAQEEAVAVMRVAIEYLFRRLIDQNGSFPAEKIKVYPAGFMLSSDAGPSLAEPLPEKVHAFAKLFSGALGTETAFFDRDETNVSFVATSIPEIQGAEARVEVRSWAATRKGYATRTDGLRLERGPSRLWKVTERLSYEHNNFINTEVYGTAGSGSEAIRFTMIDDKPQIIGGQEALYEALKYPEAARTDNVEDPTVFLQFIVAPDGQVRDLSVLSTPHEAFSKEAKRALRKMRFEPGRQNGKAVPVRMSMPIRFKK